MALGTMMDGAAPTKAGRRLLRREGPAGPVAAALLLVAGCAAPAQTEGDAASEADARAARRVAIEVDDPSRGLPCRVAYWGDDGTRRVLWRARFEEGFCRRKAAETQNVLRAQGWACQPDPAVGGAADDGFQVVAAWRCERDFAIADLQPPAPSPPPPRPDRLSQPSPLFDDPALKATVERDLAAIGHALGEAVEAARGDLDGDGVEDAVVALTRQLGERRRQRLVMAYLRNDDDYHLVDVHILGAEGESDDVALAIRDGAVQLAECCDEATRPVLLALRDRKLARVDGDRP
jgi:hypothetical protein